MVEDLAHVFVGEFLSVLYIRLILIDFLVFGVIMFDMDGCDGGVTAMSGARVWSRESEHAESPADCFVVVMGR